MKLISCHIENFGKLHQFDMSFSDGLNVVCRENGWGKSTLAAFLKTMLYGLDGSKKRDLDENERRKFTPWQGGVFGGRMEFEAGQKRYVVTRTFGDSPAKDTFELRDAATNLISHDFSEALGEELFRLNRASFCRSIFIGQNDCPTSSTDDIHARISHLADNTGDMNSFESADERLKRQINALSPKLRSGSLFRLSEETAALRRKVAEGSGLLTETEHCENQIAEKEAEKKSLMDKRASLEAEQKRVVRMQERLSLRREWERLKKARDLSKGRLDTALAAFPSGIPADDEVREQLRACVEMKSAEGLMHSYELSEPEKSRLTALDSIFGKAQPSTDDFERYLKLTQQLGRVREKYERLRLSNDEQDRFLQLNASFADDEISPSELAERWNERRGVSHSLGSKRSACAVMESSVKKTRAAGKRRAFFLTATGGIIIAAALALFVIFSDTRFLMMTLAGLLLVATGAILTVLITGNIVRKYPDELLQLRKTISQDEGFVIETDALVENYLDAHGMLFNESDVPVMLQELCGEKRDLDMLRSKSEAAEQYRRESNLTALYASIGDFLGKYGVQPDADHLSDQLYGLKETLSEYETLCEKRGKYESAEQVCQSKGTAIGQFLERYGFGCHNEIHETLEAMHVGIAECNRLSVAQAEAENQLSAFEQSHDMTVLRSIDGEQIPSLEAISEEISECITKAEEISDSINTLRQSRDSLYARYAEWESDSALLLKKTEMLAEQTRKYERLLRTRELLRKAKETMVARYVDPVCQAFKKYHETVTGASSDSYLIDAEVRLTVRELGQQREIKSLSTGFRDLAGICLRLGLADAMFREEKPMLIMDDPFTNLDDEKAEAAKKLLRTVSDSYQVLYFICSKTRQ